MSKMSTSLKTGKIVVWTINALIQRVFLEEKTEEEKKRRNNVTEQRRLSTKTI